MHQRDISFLDLTTGELLSKLPVSLIIFRNRDQAAGLFVEPMHDARTHLSADRRQRREVMQQRIDQRSPVTCIFRRARPCMDHHPGRLVDDGQVIILINDVERYFLRDRP